MQQDLQKKRITTDWIIILLLAAVKLIIHLCTNTNYSLHRDEYLYLAFADHLDFGYFSNAPLIGILSFLIQTLLGTSVFAVRLLPAVTGTVIVLLVGAMVKELDGKKWAILLAGLAVILSPAYLRINWLFQPVSFDLLFWLLATYIILKLVRSDNPKYWLPLGAVWGLGFLNKYSISFLAFAFLVALLLTDKRKLILSRYFVFHLLIGFVLILPNLIWQYQHNWPVVFHMQNLRSTQLVNIRMADFLLAQPLMTLPAFPLWICGLYYFLFSKSTKSLRVLGITFVIVLVLFMLLQGKAYYTLGIYFIMIAGGSVWIEEQTEKQSIRFIKPVLLILMVLVILPGIPFSLPVLTFEQMEAYGKDSKKFGLEVFLHWEDGHVHPLPQDYADMTGWEELSEIVIRTYQDLGPDEKEHCVIYSENYGQAGSVKYFGRKDDLPEPVSFSDNFLFWAPDYGEQSILIYINDDTTDIAHFFGSVEEMGRIKNPLARESGLPVFLCREPRNNFKQFYMDKARSLKDQFRRTAPGKNTTGN